MEGSSDLQTSKKNKPLTRIDVDKLLNEVGSSKLNLSGRNLTGIDLSNFDLDNANLSDADLTLANLSGADLTKANLTKSLLVRANLNNARLRDADLTKADLREATLVNADLWGARLNQADLSYADLTKARVTVAYFNEANLTKANLIESDLGHSDFVRARLIGADLTKARLRGANLNEADLTEAIFNEADLSEADLRKAILSESTLDGAILSNTKVRGTTITTSSQNKANKPSFANVATQTSTYTPPPVIGTLGTPGLTKRQVIESIQIEQIAQANPANIQEVAATQLPIGNRYYESVLEQSQHSFLAALVLSIVGTLLIFASIIFLLIRQPPNISYVSLVGGVVLDVIGGLNFYLYGRASALLLTFQPPLDRIGRFLLANSVCENLDGDLKNTTRAKLVEIIANVPVTTHKEIAEADIPPRTSKVLHRSTYREIRKNKAQS